MYKARIKDSSFDFEFREGQLFIEEGKAPLAYTKLPGGGYEIRLGDEQAVVDIVKIDTEQKQVILRIRNKRYTVSIQEPVDLLLEKLGISIRQAKKINNLKAPMPGLVTKLLVSEGDEVKQGQPLLVLEAMKMENVFKAASDVKIKSIKVSEKQAVEKGEELIAFA